MSTNIKTWRERYMDNLPMTEPMARDAEVSELRAQLEKYEAQMLRMATCAGEFARDACKAQAPSAPVAPEAAEDWLRQRYGAARGHLAWRDLAEAFNAGAALSVKAETAVNLWEQGVLMAAAIVIACHDMPVVAGAIIGELGLSTADCSSMDEFDKAALRKVQGERSGTIALRGLDAAPTSPTTGEA